MHRFKNLILCKWAGLKSHLTYKNKDLVLRSIINEQEQF